MMEISVIGGECVELEWSIEIYTQKDSITYLNEIHVIASHIAFYHIYVSIMLQLSYGKEKDSGVGELWLEISFWYGRAVVGNIRTLSTMWCKRDWYKYRYIVDIHIHITITIGGPIFKSVRCQDTQTDKYFIWISFWITYELISIS